METEIEIEMQRFIQITAGWSGNHRFKVLCHWTGAARMREMNSHLEALVKENRGGPHAGEAETGPQL